jgi:hypothetical protein
LVSSIADLRALGQCRIGFAQGETPTLREQFRKGRSQRKEKAKKQ